MTIFPYYKIKFNSVQLIHRAYRNSEILNFWSIGFGRRLLLLGDLGVVHFLVKWCVLAASDTIYLS